MPFRYLRDPLFLTCFGVYWINQYLFKPNFDDPFLHESFSNLLCVPILVPLFVSGTKMLGLRPDDRPPQINEILLPLLVWSITIQVVFPGLSGWSDWVINDSMDIAWYCTGAVVAAFWWTITHAPKRAAKPHWEQEQAE